MCTAGIGAPASASIQIVATKAVLDLAPRTLVHLFYLDADQQKDFAAVPKDQYDTDELKLVGDIQKYIDDDRYKLLFAGELFTVQFAQTFSNRSAVLQCQDFSSYWGAARVLFAEGKGTSSKTKAMAFSSGAVLRFDKLDRKPFEVILDIIQKKKSLRHPDVQGLMGGLLLLLEYIGGVYDEKDGFRGINDFFSSAELRLHLSRMVGTAANDDTTKLLLGTSGFAKTLRRAISSMGNTVGFDEILGMVFQQLQANRYPVLAPHYSRKKMASFDVKTTKKIAVSIGDTATDRLAQLEHIRAQAAIADAGFGSMTVDAGMSKMESGAVSTGNPLIDFEATHVFGAELAKFAAAADPNYATAKEASVKGSAPITSELKADQKLGPVAKLDQFAVTLAAKMTTGRKESTRFGELEEFPGINIGTANQFRQAVTNAVSGYEKAKIKVQSVDETITGTTAPWLYTQVIAPELFLCAPPKCNVIFPEHIGQLQYAKEWHREITRLHLTTRKEWEAQSSSFQKQQYIAPAISTVHKDSALDQFEGGKSFIFPHEAFSGIIAKYDQTASVPAYQKLAKNQASEVGDDYKLDKVDYLQRIANFLFIKYRIGPRTMSISGRFNPRPVVGLPGMIFPNAPSEDEAAETLSSDTTKVDFLLAGIDSTAYSNPQVLVEQFEEKLKLWREERQNPPEAYSGLLHSIVHNLTQDGGQTRYTFTHIWNPYSEEIPGMGNFEIKVPKSSGPKTTVYEGHSIDGALLDGKQLSVTSKDVLSPTQQSGAENKLIEFNTPDALNSSVATSTKQTGALLGGRTLSALFLIKAKTDAKLNAEEWTGPQGGTVTSIVFSKPSQFFVEHAPDGATGEPGLDLWVVRDGKADVTITEIVTTYTRKKLGEIPFEYAARPPWLSSVYSNSKIGSAFYSKVLGCSSVCDAFKKFETQLVENAISQLRVVEEGAEEETQESLESKPLIQSLVQDFVTGHVLKDAADGILQSYLQNKWLGRRGVLGKFIDAFTERPVATLNEVLGSRDLKFDSDGKGNVIAGREGFHSRAFGERTDYVLLDHPKLLQYGGAGEEKKLDPTTDPRKPRSLIVSRYLEQLSRIALVSTRKKLGVEEV